MAKKERRTYTESKNLTKKQKIGNLGEDIVETFLMKHGFVILERNYWKKWGEIDIVARKATTTYFVEVKSVSCKTLPDVNHETNDYRPEDNMHPYKLKRLSRTIQSYLLENVIGDNWQFDICVVYIDDANRVARVKHTENIIL